MSNETQQATAPAAPIKAVPEATQANTEAVATPAPEAVADAQVTEDSVAATEAGLAALSIGQAEMHLACAEGRLEDVRAILGRGLESLETLDLTTGMTPIVLAIQNGHGDVVRELLAAGAIVPPPGVTGDPVMHSILYPQHMYGVPPPFAQMGPPQFYAPQSFYHSGHVRSPSSAPNSAGPNGAPNANLPPAEVAKTIPCRNFPNCKYGASCMFFHPRPQNPGFFPAPGYGYEGFVPYPNGVPFFGTQEFVPGSVAQTPGEPTAEGAEGLVNGEPTSAISTTTQHDSIPASAQVGAHVPSPIAPAFVPGGAPFMGSPTGGFAVSPLSPTLMPSAGPNDPAFFATSPQFQQFVPNGFTSPHGRRPSFGQFPNGAPPKPYHGKKPSFSGGPKPWGPGGRAGGSSHLGTWKDGIPPPCAFFREGKCRNGEFCKFPHIDAEGNDVRHPDIIRGIIAPAPTRPSPRVVRMMAAGAHYDPRHQPYVQGKQAAAAAAPAAQPVAEIAEGVEGAEAEAEASTPASPAATESKEASPTVAAAAPAPATLPPKPSGSSVPPSRSTSQAGGSRVNGVHSRSHSPNGTNSVRRGPRYANGHANGSRSSSANPDKKTLPPQRIPRADEFPALGLSTPSTPTTERREPSWGSKTAAQILSEPAPVRATPAASPTAEEKTVVDVVTMDSDSEQDAVIISVSTTPNPEVAAAKAAKIASAVSFAAVASTIGTEAAPVALKA